MFCAATRIPRNHLILTYKDVPIFSLSTPRSLGIEGNSTVELNACSGSLEDYVNESERRAAEHLKRLVGTDSAEEAPYETVEVEDDSFVNIKLSAGPQMIEKYRTRRTVPLGQVVDRFCEKHHIKKGSLRLIFDGSLVSLASSPCDLGLEDGDMIDVSICSLNAD